MSAPRIDTEVLVIGDGAAGIAAARTAFEAGAKVTIISTGPGATAFAGGAVWGSAAEPFTSWAKHGRFQLGGRFVTLGGWVLADVVGGLSSLLDLRRLAPHTALGVLDLPTHPGWSPRALASALGATVVPLGDFPEEESFHATARRFDTDGVVEAAVESLRAAIQGRGIGAILTPPVLGLRRDDVARRLSAALGIPVGETVSDAGDPPSIRLSRALRAWIPGEVEVIRGHASARLSRGPDVTIDGTKARARAVVLATGGVTGGGVSFGGSVREATAGAPLWLRNQRIPANSGAARGEDPSMWFGGEDPAIFRTGLRCNERAQVVGADGVEVPSPWLFAAGELLRGRAGGGIAGALATGALAGAEAARFVRGG